MSYNMKKLHVDDWRSAFRRCQKNRLNLLFNPFYTKQNLITDTYKKPKNYKEILNILDKLSEDFSFIRVDLFILENKIYFGELAFMPIAGYMKFTDKNTDKLWGDWIDNKITTVGEIL